MYVRMRAGASLDEHQTDAFLRRLSAREIGTLGNSTPRHAVGVAFTVLVSYFDGGGQPDLTSLRYVGQAGTRSLRTDRYCW